jgi:hypothetical protein
MFRLITIVKRGTASDLAEEWIRYPTLDEARACAKALSRDERVGRIVIVSDDEVPARFVEWAAACAMPSSYPPRAEQAAAASDQESSIPPTSSNRLG